jgi:mycofactocin system creatininase family protein
MTGLGDLSWPDLAAGERVLAVPLGATEQHGPHLPFTVDTDIAVELCARLCRATNNVVTAPPVPYGSSGEHSGFAGTLSIGQNATELLLVELVRSADVFRGVILVCAHGGNAVPLRRAVTQLRHEGRRVLPWAPTYPADDTHAGRTETSVMLALRPESVHISRAQPGNTAPVTNLMGRLRAEGVLPVSPNGVLGNPSGASANEGELLLGTWTHELVSTVDRYFTQD